MVCVLVSACLLGEAVRYDALPVPCPHAVLRRWLAEGRVVSFCPEVSAGLPAPRPPAEIRGGTGTDVLEGRAQVFDRTGLDLTDTFVAAARNAVQIAQARGVRLAVLKERSPSCGSSVIYDGTFAGATMAGAGVTAALLRRHGIAVFTELALAQAGDYLRDLEQQ